MTESSTEETAGNPEVKQEPKQVPIGVVAKERAEKREARADADAARKELAEQKESPKLDKELLDALAVESARLMEQRLAPLEAEAAEGRKYKLAVQMGLNEAQVGKVLEVRAQNPNLSNEDSLLIARTRFQDVFPRAPQSQWNRAAHGGVPVGGDSDSRQQVGAEQHLAKMREAQRTGDRRTAHDHAMEAFRHITNSVFDRMHPQS